MRKTLTVAAVAAALALGAPPVAGAIEAGEKIWLHGYGNWAYGKTDGNAYMNGNDEGNYDELEFSLSVAAEPVERTSIHAQIFIEKSEEGSEASVDFAFAEYAFDPALQVPHRRRQAALRHLDGDLRRRHALSLRQPRAGDLRPRRLRRGELPRARFHRPTRRRQRLADAVRPLRRRDGVGLSTPWAEAGEDEAGEGFDGRPGPRRRAAQPDLARAVPHRRHLRLHRLRGHRDLRRGEREPPPHRVRRAPGVLRRAGRAAGGVRGPGHRGVHEQRRLRRGVLEARARTGWSPPATTGRRPSSRRTPRSTRTCSSTRMSGWPSTTSSRRTSCSSSPCTRSPATGSRAWTTRTPSRTRRPPSSPSAPRSASRGRRHEKALDAGIRARRAAAPPRAPPPPATASRSSCTRTTPRGAWPSRRSR